MLTRIRMKLDVKIILLLSFDIVFMIGVYTNNDIRNMQMDTILTVERSLGAFTAAINGGVNAFMKSGHHEDVKQILGEVFRQSIVDRVLIYNEVVRGTDTIAHFRGEAIVVVMQGTDPEGTAHEAKARRLKTETKLLVSGPESEVIEA